MNVKIAVVGAGRVGSTAAYSLAASGLAREIVVIDTDRDRAEGEAMDIAHAVPFFAPVAVRAGTLEDAAGALITVIAAGSAQRKGETRPELGRRNLQVLDAVVPQLARLNPEGLILVATNPVDALTQAAIRLAGLPAGRIFGTGTVLDTARLRSELSAHYGVDARNVHAYVLGEHGDSEVIAWSAATLANAPLEDFCRLSGLPCSEADMTAIGARVRDAAYAIIRRKGATNFAIAAAITRIVEAVVRDEASVLTVSVPLSGEYGMRSVCLSLPAIIGRSGVRRVLAIPLAAHEADLLQRSGEAVANTIGTIA